ncbi:hypothetical protein D3C72_1669570 [compost metagenome]
MNLSQLGQPLAAFLYHQPIAEQAKAFQHHFHAGSNQRLPLRFVRLLALIQAEVFAVLVGTDVEVLVIVIDTVFMILAARHKHLRRAVGAIGVQQQNFRGGGAAQVDQNETFGGGFFQPDVEGVIELFVDQFIKLRIGTYHMAIDLIR